MRGHIALVGMMGVGKTAVGHEIARRLGVGFSDSDAEIERASAMTIPEIFARDGEGFFRDRESKIIERLLSAPAGVVSTGGGAWIQPANRDAIRTAGLSVWLDADLETMWGRVRHRTNRPLLMTADPKAALQQLCKARNPIYGLADLRVPAWAGSDVDCTAKRVIAEIIRARPGFLE